MGSQQLVVIWLVLKCSLYEYSVIAVPHFSSCLGQKKAKWPQFFSITLLFYGVRDSP